MRARRRNGRWSGSTRLRHDGALPSRCRAHRADRGCSPADGSRGASWIAVERHDGAPASNRRCAGDIARPPPTGLPRSRPLHHSPPRARQPGADLDDGEEPDPSRRRDGGPTRAAGGPGGAKPQGTLASTHSGGQPNARGRVHSGGWACGFSVRFSPPVGWAVENNTAVFPHVCAQLWMNHSTVLPQIHSSEQTCG